MEGSNLDTHMLTDEEYPRSAYTHFSVISCVNDTNIYYLSLVLFSCFNFIVKDREWAVSILSILSWYHDLTKDIAT